MPSSARASRSTSTTPNSVRGQQELTTGHAPALEAADTQIMVREAIRGVAAAVGSRLRWHRSRGRTPRKRVPHPLLAVGRPAECFLLAGCSALARGSRVYGRSARSPSGLVWAHRSQLQLLPAHLAAHVVGRVHVLGVRQPRGPLRVPSVFSGVEEASTNVELKAADTSCNPYLALGGIIAAGWTGSSAARAARAGRRRSGDARDGEREARGIARLPETQGEALDALEADSLLAVRLAKGCCARTSRCGARSGRRTRRRTRHSSIRATF